MEDGYWSIKGIFKDALEENEEIEWVTGEGLPTITICAVSETLSDKCH